MYIMVILGSIWDFIYPDVLFIADSCTEKDNKMDKKTNELINPSFSNLEILSERSQLQLLAVQLRFIEDKNLKEIELKRMDNKFLLLCYVLISIVSIIGMILLSDSLNLVISSILKPEILFYLIPFFTFVSLIIFKNKSKICHYK